MIYKAVLVVFLVLLLAGCNTAQTKEERELKRAGTGLLEPSVMQKFQDVPVPAKFKFMEQDSYTFENSGLRVGVLKYRGKADPTQVVDFYKEQMPMYNWNLLNVVEYGQRLLNFDRDNETCIISISSKGNSIEIIASIGPRPQATVSKKAAKPLK
jgi:hypothetical protein